MRLHNAHNHRRDRRGFTLVEILIVVIILGILASIIIGLFNNTSKDASYNSLKDDLRTMRSMVQLYLAQHGSYPALATFEPQMTLYSDASGNTSPTRSTTYPYGPYILRMPPLPAGTEKGKTTVTTMSSYSAGYGWQYDPNTGKIRANCPDSDVDAEGIPLNTY
jgi:prepilin-type N-terminal cleavage/methylation domain-containing protein